MQRRSSIQKSLGFDGQGKALGHAANLVVQHAHIGVRQLSGSLVALGHDEIDNLLKGSLFNLVGFFCRELYQRHGDSPVAAGQLKEIVGAKNLGLVREQGQHIHLLIILGSILEDGEVFLDFLFDVLGFFVPNHIQEVVGCTDAAKEFPLGINGRDGAPVAVGEALDGGFRVCVFGIVGATVAKGAAHIINVLVGHIAIDIGEHLLNVAVAGEHILTGEVGRRLVKIQDVATCTQDHQR